MLLKVQRPLTDAPKAYELIHYRQNYEGEINSRSIWDCKRNEPRPELSDFDFLKEIQPVGTVFPEALHNVLI